MAIAKPNTDGNAPRRDGGGTDSPFARGHPTLVEYLSNDKYDDGSVRKTSTVTLFVEDGSCKACLSDRDLGRTAWASGWSVEDVLAAIELQLADGSIEWRKSVGGGRRK